MDGKEALQKIKNNTLNNISLIILDIIMPAGYKNKKMDGRQMGVYLYDVIRKKKNDIPIIILSVIPLIELHNLNFENDLHLEYLSKDISLVNLENHVRKMIGGP